VSRDRAPLAPGAQGLDYGLDLAGAGMSGVRVAALPLPRSIAIYPEDNPHRDEIPHEDGMRSQRSGRSSATVDEMTMQMQKTAADESRLRHEFWKKLKRVALKLPFVEDLLAAYYCAFDRDTPMQVKAALVGAIGYFLLPADFVPDLMPMLGFTDDAAVLATAIRMVATHLRPEHREAARRALARGLAEDEG
jgi:uncharacterized membrane protein YkvA (DUF1232 family)